MAIDLPRHGLADPFDYQGVNLLDLALRFLTDVIGEVGVDSVDIVAHSVGSLWAVTLALDNPGRVSRLILVGAPAGVQRPNVPIQLRLLGLPFVGQFLGRRLMRRFESSRPDHDSEHKRPLRGHPGGTFWRLVPCSYPCAPRMASMRCAERSSIAGVRWA
jgi:pimeloyl-ACP methyl ester carboxylesterase